jgi:uncharacterized protein (TIGR02996 family)
VSRALVEAAIEANPDDERAWAVYADLLIAEGDPRGEWVAAGLYNPSVRQRDALLGAAARFDRGGDTFVWHHAFLREVNLHQQPDEITDAVGEILAHPAARFLRYLDIFVGAFDAGRSWQSLLDVIVEAQPRCLEHLTIADGVEIGDVDGVLALPKLAELSLTGRDVRLSRSSPTLRQLLLPRRMSVATVRAIGSLEWPRLDSLSLWLPPSGGMPEDVRGILEGRGLPSLHTLGLLGAPFGDALVDEILGSAILPRLRELDLSFGTLSDEGARRLLAERAGWQHLDRLHVQDNQLSASVEELGSMGNVTGLGFQGDE